MTSAFLTGEPSSEKPTALVQGKVTYKGVPLPEGIVLFLGEDRRQDIGSINPDGTYVSKRALYPKGDRLWLDAVVAARRLG